MKIKTNFSVGDVVYHIRDSEVYETNVNSIDITVNEDKKMEIVYKTDNGFYFDEETTDVEDMLFATTDALCEYLKNNIIAR